MSVENARKSCVDCARAHKRTFAPSRRLCRATQNSSRPHRTRKKPVASRFSLKSGWVWCCHDGKSRRKYEISPCFRCSASTPERFSSRHESANPSFNDARTRKWTRKIQAQAGTHSQERRTDHTIVEMPCRQSRVSGSLHTDGGEI